MDKQYEVREWSMTDARTGETLRGFGVYWPGKEHPFFTTPRRDAALRWANDHNKRIAARKV